MSTLQTCIVQTRHRSRRRLLLLCLAVFALLLCLDGQQADADFETTFHYIDYEATVVVGESVTFYDMPFSAIHTDHYSKEYGPPGRFVHETGEDGAVGLNAFDVEYAIENVHASGSYTSSLNSYSCGVTMTVTGTQVGSGVVTFSYSTWGVPNSSGCTIQVPRITVHVVDSGTSFVSTSPRLSWSTAAVDAYPAAPTAARPGWTFDGWKTDGANMYALWVPDFSLYLAEPGNNDEGIIYNGSGDTFATRQAVIPYNTDSGLHHDGFTYSMTIPEYWNYKGAGVEQEPVWQVQEITDTGTAFRVEHWYENRWFLRTDGERPQSETDVQARVSCAWGGTTRSFDLLIHYQDVALPTGTDIPLFIDVPYNSTAYYDCHFADGYVFDNRVWFTGKVDDDSGRMVSLFYWDNDGYTFSIRPNEAQPGCYAGVLTLIDGNVAFDTPVIYRVLNPDGSIPAPDQLGDAYDLNFLLMPEDTKGYDMFPEDWGHINLNNPEVLRMMYGDSSVSVTVEHVRGTRLDMSAHIYRDMDSIVLDIRNLDELADGAYSVVDVTLHWGEWTETTRVTIFFTRPEMPDIEFERDFTLKVGEEYVATLGLSDENWTDDYFLWYDFNDDSQFEKWSDRADFHILPLEPGWYVAAPHIHAVNMRIQGEPFAFAVTDENGNLPELPELAFHYQGPGMDAEIENGGTLELRQAVVPYESENDYLHSDEFLGNLYLDGYEVMRNFVDGEPEMYIEKLTESDVEVRFEDTQLRSSWERPQSAAEEQFEIGCDWGDFHSSFTLTIVYDEIDMPTGVDIPDVIDLRLGEETAIEVGFSDGWAYQNRLWATGFLGDGDWQWFSDMFDWDYRDNALHIVPHDAGYYSGRLNLVDTNVSFGKDVLFRIANEDGTLPELPVLAFQYQAPGTGEYTEIKNGGTLELRQAVIPYESESEYFNNDDFLGSLFLDGYDVLRFYLDGEPEMYINKLTESDVVLNLEGTQLLTGREHPQSATEARFEIGCDWGDFHSSFTLTIVYDEIDLPTGVDIPDVIDLRLGEENAIEVGFSDGWAYQNQLWTFGFLGDGDWQWFDGMFDRWVEGDTLYLIPHEVGYYYGRLYLVDTNVSFGKDVFFRVADKAGNLPELVPYFWLDGEDLYESDCMLGTPAYTEDGINEGWVTRQRMFAWTLDNLAELEAEYGPDPEIEWSWEYVDGMELQWRIEPEMRVWVVGDSCAVTLEELPQEPGFACFNLVCTWNGHSGVLPVRINFIEQPERVPQDSNFPSRIILPVGQSIFLTGMYADGEYDVDCDFSSILLEENDCVDIDWIDDLSFSLTGRKTGAVSGVTHVGCNARGIVQKRIDIVITDEAVRLPDGLTEIEEEAFAGIDDIAVYLPASVQTIGDGAFEPTATIYCEEGSPAYFRCMDMGLFVVGLRE